MPSYYTGSKEQFLGGMKFFHFLAAAFLDDVAIYVNFPNKMNLLPFLSALQEKKMLQGKINFSLNLNKNKARKMKMKLFLLSFSFIH